MGVLAYDGEAPVGWAACGPRMRYREVSASGRRLLVQRPRAEDLSAWLLPCIFVHADYRGQGVSHALVEAVVSTARHEGAVALEGWPLAQDEARSADAFVGREELFDALGFRRVAEPVPGRVIMRLDLVAD